MESALQRPLLAILVIDHTIVTCSVVKHGLMSLTATLTETKQGVDMEVSLSTGFPTTGYATGEVYLMLTERSRYEDKCSAETLGNIISRKIRSRTDHSGDVKVHDIALHEFKLINSNGQKTILSDLPFKSLSDYAGKALALCSAIEYGGNGHFDCKDKIYLCCKLGWDNKKAEMRPYWFESPAQIKDRK